MPGGLWVPILLVALGVVTRILFLTEWRTNFDADEALVALQAMQVGDGYWPPFLASVKARGGNLESLVLLLWSTALLWEACRPACSRVNVRYLLAGALLGVAVWTHDQTLLGVPLIITLLAVGAVRGAWRGVPIFIVAALLGFVSLWWPQLAPHLIGPVGAEGTGLTIDWAALPRALPMMPDMLRQCLVAGAQPGIWIRILNGTLVLLSAGAFLWLLGSTLRRFPRQMATRPLEVTVLCLALGNLAVLLLGPIYQDDRQWFRYTLYLAPAILVARARALSLLPKALGIGLHVLVIALTLVSYGYASPAWKTAHTGRDAELVELLQEKEIEVVLTSWKLAYTLRFLSQDQILASSGTPPRYFVADMIARFHPQCHRVRRLAFNDTEHSIKGADLGELYDISLLQRPAQPPEIIEQLDRLDPIKTLVVHLEPYPLLPPGGWPQNWRGWPPQRPLDMFETIVWCPRFVDRPSIDWDTIAERIERLTEEGTFIEVARVRTNVILRRASAER